jgi:hypothetical protein
VVLFFVMPRVDRALLGCVLVFVAASGCDSESPSLSIDLRTDLVAQVEFDTVRVVLGGDRQDTNVDADTPWLDAVRVARFEDLSIGTQSLELQLLRDGEVLIRRPTSAQLLPGINVVTIVVTRSCLNVRCPGADPAQTACLGGQCVNPGCSQENPELCAEPECDVANACASMADCAEARCISGVCAYASQIGACDDGSSCIPEEGCRVNEPAVADASMPDASMPDASMPDAGPLLCDSPPCLLLHYDFEGAVAGPLVDESGNGHDAALIGEPATAVEGPVGQAWQFDQNVDEYLSSFEVPAGVAYTLAFWVRIDQVPGECCVQYLIKLEDPAGATLVLSSSSPSGRMVTQFHDGSNGSRHLSTFELTSEWHHHVYEVGEGGAFIAHYLDGVEESRSDWLALPRAVARIRIGRVGAGGLATLDEIRFYTGALSEAEIMVLATPVP